MSERNILLGGKAECLRMFALLLPTAVKECAEKLFAMAYKTTNFAEHHLFLGAYGVLTKREAALIKKLQESLSELLDRSIATAYNPARPPLSKALSAEGWSLVDSSIIEDEIRLQKATSLFHARCGADIRDLNLRIATLFRQELVKERENPFRPYVFSRCIYTAVSNLGTPPDATMTLIDHLSTQLLDGVAGIYKALNSHFEKSEITARLPSVGRQSYKGSAAESRKQALPNSETRSIDDVSERKQEQEGTDHRYAASENFAGREAIQGHGSQPVRAAAPLGKIDQLLHLVRRSAWGGSEAASGSMEASGGSGTSRASGGFMEAQTGSADYSSSDSAGHGFAGGIAANPRGMAFAANSFGGNLASGPAPYSASPMANPDMTHGWLLGRQVIGDALQRFFVDDDGEAAVSGAADSAPPDAAGSRRSHADGAVYQLLKKAPATRLEDVLDHDGNIRNLILEQRPALTSRASDADEMMTIDVVGMIFEFILRDPQVPAEVRAQLGRLQLLLLKIALLDPQLLTRKTHPARLLINRIGTIAIGLKSNDAFSARVTAEIQRIVEVLLGDDSGSVALFARVLREFEDFIARESCLNNENIERAVEVVEEAEKRSSYLARLSDSLKKVFESVKTDPYLQNFIETVWVHAVEKAEHTDAALALRYRKLVPELVWSILEKRTERERARLLAHLPQMLFDLKAGLNLVKHVEKQVFLGWLIESHTRAIKTVSAGGEVFSLTALRQQFQDFVDISLAAAYVPAGKVQLDPRFIRDTAEDMKVRLDEIDTALESDNDTDDKDPDAADIASAGAVDTANGDPFSMQNVLNRLRVGVPVEINIDGAPRRSMLNWMSRSATTMILSLEGNDFPTTISVQLFRRLLANNRARFAEAAPLFERAVAALLDTAGKVDEICA